METKQEKCDTLHTMTKCQGGFNRREKRERREKNKSVSIKYLVGKCA
jgi:hypothetical protein